ncbi:MAG TPA: hydrogenase maturation protease [Rhizomicrobium sp.]|jgi:hydrogenase maturation protease
MSGILVAGIGNIFQGDDAFGVEVAQRLARRILPAGVTVGDFGIRGIDLTYALMDDYEAVILVDAARRGERPGVVSVIAPDRLEEGAPDPGELLISPHDLDPAKVLRIVAVLGGGCRRILLVACEPQELGGEDGCMGLSPPVAAAVEPAIETIEALIGELRQPARELAYENRAHRR